MADGFTGQLIANKYRVEERIATSGLGEFYRGTNELLEKPVAISLLASELAVDRTISGRFFSEAKAAAKINHPNILNLTDFGTDASGVAYAVYEAANGETLHEAMTREGQLPLYMAADIANRIALALAAGHAAGLVHGNLSPTNVIVGGSEPGTIAVKVFSFGTPNAIDDDNADSERFAYLAPEQCAGADSADERGDVYSLGVILFEMLAGSRPFTGTTPTDVMMRQIEEPPPPLSAFRQDLPAGVEPVVLKALAKDPEARYQTAGEFADELKIAAEGGAVAAAAAVGDSNNNIWKTAFVVLAGVSLLTVALIYATSVKQTDPATALQPDANGMPVQPINPSTGVEEQNLANLPPDYTTFDANTNTALPPGTVPGDAGNPWLNGGAPPPPGAFPQGGGTVTVPMGQSPFMQDAGCVMQPSGILLCPVPVTPTPAPKATPTPKSTPAANANTATTPAATPTPRAAPAPARSPTATPRTPAANRPEAEGESEEKMY